MLLPPKATKSASGKMKKLVPVYQENAVDDDLLNEGRRNLRNYMQTRGYFDADGRSGAPPKTGEDQVNIVYKIDPGEKHKLAAVKIRATNTSTAATIRERWRAAGQLGPDQRAFQPADDARGRESIKYLYLANGFLDVKVDAELADDYEGKKDRDGGACQDRRRPADTGRQAVGRRLSGVPSRRLSRG